MEWHNVVGPAKLLFPNLIQETIAVSRFDNASEFFKPPGFDLIAGITGNLGPTIVDKHELAILDHMDADQ
ncbi:MAG: hypothetical protein ABIH24_10740 [Verrucomicrobiota bacterium]